LHRFCHIRKSLLVIRYPLSNIYYPSSGIGHQKSGIIRLDFRITNLFKPNTYHKSNLIIIQVDYQGCCTNSPVGGILLFTLSLARREARRLEGYKRAGLFSFEIYGT